MPLPSAIKSNAGVRGLAEVRVLRDTIRVIFKADGDTYELHKDGWERETGIYNVTLNKENDKIKYSSPPGRPEPYLVRFNEFGNRVGRTDDNPGVPEPKVRPGKQMPGKNGGFYWVNDSLEASAKLVVVEHGLYEGMTIPYSLPYIFEQYPGSTITMLKGTAAQNRRIEDFLRAAGFDLLNDEIPWTSNVLPYLEFKLQEASGVFSVQLNENGFVAKDGVRSIPASLVEALIGDAKAAKKPKAKAKAKAKA